MVFQTGFSDQLLADRPLSEGRKADRPLLGGLMSLANTALSSGLTQKDGESGKRNCIASVYHAGQIEGSSVEKRDRAVGEEFVILEDAAMAGVGVKDEFGTRNAAREIS